MLRNKAIEILAQQELKILTPTEREALLVAWWGINTQEPEYQVLAADLQEEIQRSEVGPEHLATDNRYDPLLLIALKAKFYGVRNEYLEQRLQRSGIEQVKVEGIVEPLYPCPCCQYRTLSERGAYEICSVCFWEDTGSDDLDTYSGPNHMTLREGQKNFAQLGAVSEQLVKCVPEDARERYLSDR